MFMSSHVKTKCTKKSFCITGPKFNKETDRVNNLPCINMSKLVFTPNYKLLGEKQDQRRVRLQDTTIDGYKK